MSYYYPVLLRLEGKLCLVIGDAYGAEEKARGLREAGAIVTRQPGYSEGDLAAYALVVAATGDPSLNQRIGAEAASRNILFNAVDDPAHCNFILPAVHRQGDLVVAVSSSGKSPAVATRLRDRFAAQVGPEYATLLDILDEMRPRVAARISDFEVRRRFWYQLVDTLLEEPFRDLFARRTGRVCLTCSFQIEDMVVLDLVRKAQPDIPVLFLDTGYHFPETYAYRDRMARLWNLNLINLQPELSVPTQEAEYGKLYVLDSNRCCKMRKVEPLMAALAGYDVWFTGLRREQSPSRAGLKTVESHRLPDGREIVKVNPLAAWTAREVWYYLGINEIEHLPLYDQGYTSIGCAPCTNLPTDPSDPRSGRWAGAKVECGIHTFAGKD